SAEYNAIVEECKAEANKENEEGQAEPHDDAAVDEIPDEIPEDIPAETENPEPAPDGFEQISTPDNVLELEDVSEFSEGHTNDVTDADYELEGLPVEKEEINDYDSIEDGLTFGDLDDEEDTEADGDLTFGDLDDDEDSEADDDLTFGDLDDDEDSETDGDLTFGDLDDDEDSEADDDLTFGDLDDEDSEADDDLTFGDLDDDEDSEADGDLTFGDLDDEDGETDGDLTFGDLDDDEDSETDGDITFGDLDDEDGETDGELTFGDLEGEDEETAETDPENDISDKSDADVFPLEPDDTHEAEEIVIAADEEQINADEPVIAFEPPYADEEPLQPEDDENEALYADSAVVSVAELVQAEMDPYHTMLEQFSDDVDEDNVLQSECAQEEPSQIQIQEEPIVEPETVDEGVILSKDEYTDDPLQWHIDRAQKKVLQKIPEASADETKRRAAEIHDDDISILLQLGYKDELNSHVGHDRTDLVVQNITNSYRPDRNKIPFGFCGKEFSENRQIQKIKQRYDFDKRTIIIKMALFACVSLVLLLLGILFKSSTDVNSVIMFSVIEIIIMALGCVIIHKDLVSGIVGIFKFSPTVFTIPIFSLFVLFAYDIFVIIACAVRPDAIAVNTTPLFGFTTSLFFIFALVSRLMNCVREQRTFDLISTSDSLYTAEELISSDGDKSEANNLRFHEIRKQIKGNAVSVKKTAYISQYFKRCSESSYGIGNVTLALGVGPLVAMILACIVIAFERGAADIATTIIFAFYMCLSASFVLIMPVTMFAASKSLEAKRCGMIGTGAIREYENVNSVIFPDSSAYEVSEEVEVLPVGEEDMNASMKTANRLFKSLGGTLAAVVGKNSFNRDESVSLADINIAFIDENGVELYMDNSTHILLGNDKFILEHRKRLSFEACDMIPASYIAGREVMYLAIDDKVSLVYIFSVNARVEFEDKVKLLASNKIKTYVATYEAHIKSRRDKDCKVGVYRPYDHESPEKPTPRCGGIVASGDEKNIVYPLLMVRRIVDCVRSSSKFSLWFILGGMAVSLAITLIGYLVPEASGILRYRDVFTIAIQLLSVIPLATSAILLWKKNK
ncbi:MAG: hypothetical protein IJW65_06260, partial [Clostridia bacterium]|nr:hypothetical protein [Clostridia bacterium]